MRFRKASLLSPQLLAEQRVSVDGVLFPAIELHIPTVAFGTTDVPGLDGDEHRAWHERTLHLFDVYRFRLRDAVVHPPHGIVTIDEWVLHETLAHIPFHLPGYAETADEVELPDVAIGGSLDQAVHAMAGNYHNYYHWLADCVTRLQIEPLAPFGCHGVVLVPPVVLLPQQEMLGLLTKAGHPVLSLAGQQSIRVGSLQFLQNLVNHGFAPNPHLKDLFDGVQRALGVVEHPGRRLYVARGDSRNRVMTNEDAVAGLVTRHGFEVVTLSGLDLATQCRMFAAASHVIAPHGAGLANLVFCNPGTSLCELHNRSYLNWCFRRLGGLRGVNYGCIVGSPEDDAAGWPHTVRWRLPLDALEAVLDDAKFWAASR